MICHITFFRDVYQGYVSQTHTTFSDDNEDFDDFSSDEDVEEEKPVAQVSSLVTVL